MVYSPMPRIHSIQAGLPRTLSDAGGGMWTTGLFKEPVPGPVRLSRLNIEGDGQADLRHHGGADKAVNVYPWEHYARWNLELSPVTLSPGGFGENFTTEGLFEAEVCVGDSFQAGEAVVQVSQPRQPCSKLSRRYGIEEFALRVQRSGRTGWYLRVLKEGTVEAGSVLRLFERPFPEWTVAEANEVMHVRKTDREASRSLASCPLLSESWRATLSKRCQT